ncbi:MAG: hypothetical protein Q7V58_09475 [Actinomycetota bacterium]|nr:hypothetical protein [Actinomycetota bacterium]
MALPSWAATTIDVVRPATTVDRGTTIVDWDAPPASDVEVANCVVAPGPSVEDLANRTSVIVRWTVSLPPGTDVLATDGIRVNGHVYRVNGEPQPWTSPSGLVDHIRVELIDWSG